MVSVLACFFGEGVVVAGAGGIVYSWSCVSKNLKCGIVEMKLDKLNILQQPYIELCFSAQRSPNQNETQLFRILLSTSFLCFFASGVPPWAKVN